MDFKDDSLEKYILAHIDSEPDYLKKLVRDTNLYTLKPRMLSGHLQGRMLKMFCSMMSARRILEIGTFTGYSALCMAEALPKGGELHTIEINDEMEDFLTTRFEENDPDSKIKLHIGDASQIIPTLEGEFDVVFMDGNKRISIVAAAHFLIKNKKLWAGARFFEYFHAYAWHIAAGNIDKDLFSRIVDCYLNNREMNESIKLEVMHAMSQGQLYNEEE